MKNIQNFTAVLERKDENFVGLCPEPDAADQGDTVEESKKNIKEVIELLVEHAPKDEIRSRLKNDFFITNVQMAMDKLKALSGKGVCKILSENGLLWRSKKVAA